MAIIASGFEWQPARGLEGLRFRALGVVGILGFSCLRVLSGVGVSGRRAQHFVGFLGLVGSGILGLRASQSIGSCFLRKASAVNA